MKRLRNWLRGLVGKFFYTRSSLTEKLERQIYQEAYEAGRQEILGKLLETYVCSGSQRVVERMLSENQEWLRQRRQNVIRMNQGRAS